MKFEPPFSIIGIPINKHGEGPETNPKKVVKTQWEVWDNTCMSVSISSSLEKAQSSLIGICREYKVPVPICEFLGECVWSEDDALPPDMETMATALPRITGIAYRNRNPECNVNNGDCNWEIHSMWVLCLSYRGNNSIYRRKK